MKLKIVINLVIILFLTMNTVLALENTISADIEQKKIYLREELQYKENELENLEGILDNYYNFKQVDFNIETLDIDLNSSKNLFRTNLTLENSNSISAEIKIRLKFDNRYSFAPQGLIKPNKIDFSNLDTRETQDIASLGLDINNKDHFISNNKDYITIILEPMKKIDGKFLLGIGRAFRERVNFNILFNIETNPIIDIAEIDKDIEKLNNDINDIKIEITSLEKLSETIEQEKVGKPEVEVKGKVSNENEAIENKTEVTKETKDLENKDVKDNDTIIEEATNVEESDVKEVSEELEEATIEGNNEVNNTIDHKVDTEDQMNKIVEDTDADKDSNEQEIEEVKDYIVEEKHLEEYHDQETIIQEENTLEIEDEINQEDFSIINKRDETGDQQDKKVKLVE